MQTNTQMGEGAKDTERGCAVTQKGVMQALVAYQQKNVVWTNTERGYAGIELQTDAERDVHTLVLANTRTREYVCSHLVGCKQTQRWN